jgi:tetratricopeptide (TPR) repeat protein
MQTNPIHQRVELISEKWEESKIEREAKVIRFRCQPDEEDMIDAFYTYMIGVDTPVLDIAFHFDSKCTDERQFSMDLLKELEEVINIWNNSEKDKRIEYVHINWKPDLALATNKNPAAVFVENFNRLAEELDLATELYAVAVFKGEPNRCFLSWLEHAIVAGIISRVRFIVSDTISAPVYLVLAKKFQKDFLTVPIDLDMPKAMEQIAAMGDPKDPATIYRPVFMKMLNAMNAKKEEEAEKHATECVRIANANLSRDPYWITQIILVYIAIGNDKIRYKRRKETLAYANKAVETAIAGQEYFENKVASGLLAQSLMFRATVYFIQKQFNEAYSDYNLAFVLFKEQFNGPLAVEASRMAARSAFKAGYRLNAIKILSEGVKLGKRMDPDMARGSSFAGVLELLLPTAHEPYISYEEIEETGEQIYGEDWKKIVYTWRKPPKKEPQQEMSTYE